MAKTFTRLTTWIMAIVHTIFAILWYFPLHGTPRAGAVSLAQLIADAVPVWAVGFSVSAALLWASLWRRRLAPWAHGFGAVSTFTYTVTSVFSALASNPPGSLMTPAAFLAIVSFHLVAQRYYRGL